MLSDKWAASCTPARYVGSNTLRLLSRRQDQVGQPRAGHSLRYRGFGILRRRRRRPFVRCPAGDDGHVVARFRQAAERWLASHALTRLWTCIVGCRSEPEIAKTVSQFAQITPPNGVAPRSDRTGWRDRANSAVARHKLRNALGSLGTHSAGIEATFLPDHAGEKLDGQSVLCRRLL